MKKYLIIGDYILSKDDDELHYIGARQLMRLYGVHPSECVIYNRDYDISYYPKHLIELRPRYDGITHYRVKEDGNI